MKIVIIYAGYKSGKEVAVIEHQAKVDLKTNFRDILDLTLDHLFLKHIEKLGSSSNNPVRFGLHWTFIIYVNNEILLDYSTYFEKHPIRVSMSDIKSTAISRLLFKDKLIHEISTQTGININTSVALMTDGLLNLPKVPVNDQDEEEDKIMVSLGIKPLNHFFKKQRQIDHKRYSIELFINSEIKASAVVQKNRFTILASSEMLFNESLNLPLISKKLRLELIKNKTVVRKGKLYVFKESFSLPSSKISAEILFGRKVDASLVWKTKSNTSLKDLAIV